MPESNRHTDIGGIVNDPNRDTFDAARVVSGENHAPHYVGSEWCCLTHQAAHQRGEGPMPAFSYDTHPDRVDSPSSYAAGWNDAKAGRQYGEGRHGPRVGARRHPVCLGMADGMCTRFADGANWCPDGTCEEQSG